MMDICILALGVMVIVLLLGIVLSKRHGRASALTALAGVSVLSLAVALAGYLILKNSLEGNPDTSIKWHKMTLPGGQATRLEYQSGTGLLVTMADGETNPIRDTPFCLANGELARLTANYVETTNNPYVTLPQPSRPLKHRISFNLSYAISTAGLGASSFGIDESGSVWCTERLYRANTGGVDAAGDASLAAFYMAVLIFSASFVMLVIPAAVTLEVHRKHKGVTDNA